MAHGGNAHDRAKERAKTNNLSHIPPSTAASPLPSEHIGSKRERFTKVHEFLVTIVAPILIMEVLHLIWEPPVYWYFFIGVVPLGSMLHLSWPFLRWRPVIAFIVCGMYVWGGWEATKIQKEKNLARIYADVNQHLKVNIHQSRSANPFDAVFEYEYDGSSRLNKHYISCYTNNVRYTNDTEFRGDEESVDTGHPTAVEAGGDSDSTRCMKIMKINMDVPLKCGDVTIVLYYAVAENPDVLKEQRFRFVATGDGRGWIWVGKPRDLSVKYC